MSFYKKNHFLEIIETPATSSCPVVLNHESSNLLWPSSLSVVWMASLLGRCVDRVFIGGSIAVEGADAAAMGHVELREGVVAHQRGAAVLLLLDMIRQILMSSN